MDPADKPTSATAEALEEDAEDLPVAVELERNNVIHSHITFFCFLWVINKKKKGLSVCLIRNNNNFQNNSRCNSKHN